jgi:cytidylate kinase
MVASIKERDERDINRKIDPLPSDPKAHGYVVIDNSVMTEDETVAAIKEELQKKQLI